MNIQCNGEQKDVAPATSVEQFIRDLGLDPESVVAECNGRFLGRDEYASHMLTEGAVLELIRFVGGG